MSSLDLSNSETLSENKNLEKVHDVVQQYSTCLTCTQPWVQSPVPEFKKKTRKFELFSGHQNWSCIHPTPLLRYSQHWTAKYIHGWFWHQHTIFPKLHLSLKNSCEFVNTQHHLFKSEKVPVSLYLSYPQDWHLHCKYLITYLKSINLPSKILAVKFPRRYTN